MNHRSFIHVAALTLVLSSPVFSAKVGEAAPDFTRNDLASRQLTLSEHRGKLVLLNFWATWCPPCREEMPLFSRWQRELKGKGLQVIGVSMDDDATSVKDFIAKYPVSYPVVMGDVKLAQSFGGVLGLPLSYLIDAQGRVVARYQGEADLAKMEAKIKEVLAQARE
ncbi:MAG: TlpA family protein disulfide reductase [Gammaproteobacteria bacterium]|jgi:cytochrome c biogenesis protein CcmG/thiol:disulfide interchange protein DsbE|nr:TlpA family protein disulfide reductase [Gammaproteobacteria bacterium]